MAAAASSSSAPLALLRGEKIQLKANNTHMLKPHPERGTLVLTNYQLAFVSDSATTYWKEISVPLLSISHVECPAVMVDNKAILEVHSRAFKFLRVAFEGRHAEAIRLKVTDCVLKLCSAHKLFCFQHKEAGVLDADRGWAMFDPMAEYQRQGIPSRHWRVTSANASYRLCSSYPPLLVVPASITDDQLFASAKFRSHGRLPCLCWKHPHKHTTVARCSQPLSGMLKRQCVPDVQLVRAIFAASPRAYILDARPLANALGNAMKGAGVENMSGYAGAMPRRGSVSDGLGAVADAGYESEEADTKLVFQNIENIHAVRKSWQKLWEMVHLHSDDDDVSWYSFLHSSLWFQHLSTVLAAALRVAEMVAVEGASVLVHCSDGWDRTAQIVSLAQLLLDPHFRSIEGFMVLVAKEWVSFGYKFSERGGHNVRCTRGGVQINTSGIIPSDKSSASTGVASQASPVFVQWLDAVHQVLVQFPRSFEFNEQLLIDMADATYSGRFGTFVYDNHRERMAQETRERTVSFWSHVMDHRARYANRSFTENPNESHAMSVIFPKVTPRALRVWEAYFHRTDPAFHSGDSLDEVERARQAHTTALEARIADLERQLAEVAVAPAKEKAKALLDALVEDDDTGSRDGGAEGDGAEEEHASSSSLKDGARLFDD